MKPIRIVLILALALSVTAPVFGGEPAFKKGEVIVEINPGVSIETINARYGTTVKQRLYNTNFYLLATHRGKKENKWRKRLSRDSDVISADLNPVITSPSVFGRSTFDFPDGVAKPGFTSQSFMSQEDLFTLLQLDEVKDRSTGRGVVVAVIDTGVDKTHPDLIGKFWQGARDDTDISDFIDKDNDPTEVWGDPETTIAGHGTFIARIITLLATDCLIMPIRAVGPDGIGDSFIVATAVKYATDHGADVINLSLGSPEPSPLLESAIAEARKHGVFVVAAVGNDNSEKPAQYPSSSEDVLAVAAMELTGQKASFSNFGIHVDVCAPGSQLISAFPVEHKGDAAAFARWSGTSFAAPFAAAEAALILSIDPAIDVKSTIEGTAIRIDNLESNHGLEGKLGRGRIEPLGALNKVNAPGDGATDHSDRIVLSRGPNLQTGQGFASVKISGARQEFVVEASGLPVTRREYGLLVDGLDAGSRTQTATNLGTVRFVFATGTLSPPPVQPVTNIRKVAVRDSTGAIVLQGEFKLDATPTDSARLAYKQAVFVSPVGAAANPGVATVKINGAYQELSVQAQGLNPGLRYSITVDGTVLGQFLALRSGLVSALFTNDGTREVLPPSLRPVTSIRVVEVRDMNGVLVRRGLFAVVATAIVTPR